MTTYFAGEMDIEHNEKWFGDTCFHSPNKDSRYDTCLCIRDFNICIMHMYKVLILVSKKWGRQWDLWD
jgi:hypothetical protein